MTFRSLVGAVGSGNDGVVATAVGGGGAVVDVGVVDVVDVVDAVDAVDAVGAVGDVMGGDTVWGDCAVASFASSCATYSRAFAFCSGSSTSDSMNCR